VTMKKIKIINQSIKKYKISARRAMKQQPNAVTTQRGGRQNQRK